MDCTTFQENELDALYGELDARASAEMAEHAATCASCGARFERMQGTRGLVRSVAVESVADDFESRIMAAVDRGLAARMSIAPDRMPMTAPQGMPYAGQHHQAPPPAQGAQGGAKIFQFMGRPAFAAAATIVLLLGGAAFLMTQRSMNKTMAASDTATTSPVASVAIGATGAAAAEAPSDPNAVALGAAVAASPSPPEMANVAPTAAASMAFAPTAVAPVVPPAVVALNAPSPRPSPPSAAPAKGVKLRSAGPSGGGSGDSTFAAGKALFNAGRFAEALPKFEAAKADNPEAELYAARCIAKTRGCGAAAPRFDAAAAANAGTTAGNRATLEGAKCYQANGELAEARKRYAVAKDEDGVATEAKQALEALDRKSAGTPAAAGHAAPKAAAPEAAPAPPSDAVMK